MKRSGLDYPDFPDLFDDTTPPDRGQWYKDLFDALVRYSRLAVEFGKGDDSTRLVGELREKMESTPPLPDHSDSVPRASSRRLR